MIGVKHYDRRPVAGVGGLELELATHRLIIFLVCPVLIVINHVNRLAVRLRIQRNTDDELRARR